MWDVAMGLAVAACVIAIAGIASYLYVTGAKKSKGTPARRRSSKQTAYETDVSALRRELAQAGVRIAGTRDGRALEDLERAELIGEYTASVEAGVVAKAAALKKARAGTPAEAFSSEVPGAYDGVEHASAC